MYLKEIDIHGFKSFANPVRLNFLPPKDGKQSITAIVGPNGSGKSNVSDAIRWVMGEQRMKHLRGKKHEDIIFSGSEMKGKLGMASVSMTLDNTGGRVPIDYDELVLTRRLYRSGESEYLINGQVVRLLDLQLMLAKAQFGQGAYAVIGQGMIDRLLLQSPEDRKHFFDEAVGIREFQMKRRQAFLKLQRTEEHVAQADLLLQEITPRLKTLSRQVKKLEERQQTECLLRETQEQYYGSLFTYYHEQAETRKAALSDVDAEYATAVAQLSIIQQELAALAQAASRQDVFDSLQQEYQDIARKKNECEREKAVLEGSLHVEYTKAGKHNVAWLEKKITELSTHQEQVHTAHETVQRQYEEAERLLGRKKQELEELLVSRTQARGTLAHLQQELLRAETEQSYQRFTGLTAVRAILEEKSRFNGGVHGAVAELGSVSSEYQLALDLAVGGHISSLVVRDDSIAQLCIEYLRTHQLGFATFLPINKIKPRFISQDMYAHLGTSGVHGFAVDLIEFDALFSDIFSYILGGTLIVDSLSVARSIGIGTCRMVTLEGDILEIGGSMKGGYRKRYNGQGLSFSKASSRGTDHSAQKIQQDISALEEKLQHIEQQYDSLHTAMSQYESDQKVLAHTLAVTQEQRANIDKEVSSLKQELSLYTLSDEEYSTVLHNLAQKKQTLDDTLIELEDSLHKVQQKITSFNEEEEAKKQRVFSLQDAMQQAQQVVNGLVEKKNNITIELVKFETKQEDIVKEVYQELSTSVEAILQKGIDVLAVSLLDTLLQSIQKLKYTLALIGGIDEEIVREYEETKQRHDDLSLQLSDLKKAMTDLRSLIDELDSLMKKKRKKTFSAIRKEFQRYFSLLFEGGKADLLEVYGEEPETRLQEQFLEDDTDNVLTHDDTPLPSDSVSKESKKSILVGVDVVASPPGKKITSLQTLSGGERTMTSIALICAILKVNPSPFVVLDEVEAALDEANTVRFTSILQELSYSSQFILITHNRTTMHSADALYGVTMGNDAISRLVSIELSDVADSAMSS